MSIFKQCRLLLWLHIKMQLGLSSMAYNYRKDRKKFGMNLLLIGCMLYGFGCLVWVYSIAMKSVFAAAVDFGLGDTALTLSILVAMGSTLIFGIFQLISLVFNAKDIEWYAHMPLKQGALFFAKFGMVYLQNLVSSLLFLVPGYLLYAAESKATWQFWVPAVLTAFLVPVLPLCIGALIALPLSWVSSKFKRQGMLTALLTFVLTIAFVVAISLGMPMLENFFETESPVLSELLTGPLPTLIMSIFPPAGWLARGLSGSGTAPLIYLGLFIAVTLAALFLSIFLAQKLYFKSALTSVSTAPSKKKGMRLGDMKQASVLSALLKADSKQLLRSPLYLMNSLSGVFFGIIVLIAPLMVGGDWGELMSILTALLQEAGDNSGLILVIATLVLSFSSTLNVAASTSISREGRNLWVGLVIPIKPRTQILGKFLSSFCISFITVTFFGICCMISLPALRYYILAALLPGLLISACTTALSMVPDLMRPKLKWDNEAEAMKQNLNSLWGMLLCTPALILVALVLIVVIFVPAGAAIIWVVLLVLGAGMAFGSVKLLQTVADSTYPRLGARL